MIATHLSGRVPAQRRARGSTGGAPRSVMDAGRGFGRRSFLRGAGLVGTAAVLSACSVPGIKVTDYQSVPDTSDSDQTVNWSNWPFYIDVAEDGSTDPTTL